MLMDRKLLLAALALSSLFQTAAADQLKGQLLKADATEVKVKDSAGKVYQFQLKDPKQVPSNLKAGQWVMVEYQPLKVAVRTPDGGRACVDCNQLQSITASKP